MQILNKYSQDEFRRLVDTVSSITRRSNNLTSRSPSVVSAWIRAEELFCLREGANTLGFVACQNIADSYKEIKSLYIYTKYRGNRYSLFLLNHISNKKGHIYFANTFADNAKHLFTCVGFKPSKISKLPLKVLLLCLPCLDLSSIYKHYAIKSSSLLIKYGEFI